MLAVVLMLSVSAQITVFSDDIIDVGDSVTLAVADTVPAGFNPGPPGANLHWDFSDISMDTSSVLNFIDPASTPYAASFPNSTIAIEGIVEDLGLEGWAYATKNISVLQIDGAAGSYDIFQDVVAPFNPPEVMFDFPVNYLDTLVQTSVIDVKIESPEPPADSLRLKVVTSTNMVVDAWGELTTPLWTGDVLRLRDTRVTTDTVWVKLLFFWVYLESSTSVSHTYKYMANGMGYPVLQFNSDSSDMEYSGINYLIPEDVGVGEKSIQYADLHIYPNPAIDEINIVRQENSLSTQYSILIYDLYGRKMAVLTSSQTQTRIDVSSYPAGVYFAVVKGENSILGKSKFMVR